MTLGRLPRSVDALDHDKNASLHTLLISKVIILEFWLCFHTLFCFCDMSAASFLMKSRRALGTVSSLYRSGSFRIGARGPTAAVLNYPRNANYFGTAYLLFWLHKLVEPSFYCLRRQSTINTQFPTEPLLLPRFSLCMVSRVVKRILTIWSVEWVMITTLYACSLSIDAIVQQSLRRPHNSWESHSKHPINRRSRRSWRHFRLWRRENGIRKSGQEALRRHQYPPFLLFFTQIPSTATPSSPTWRSALSSSTKSSTTSYTIVSPPLLSFLTPSGDVSVGVRLLHRDDRRLSRLHDHLQRSLPRRQRSFLPPPLIASRRLPRRSGPSLSAQRRRGGHRSHARPQHPRARRASQAEAGASESLWNQAFTRRRARSREILQRRAGVRERHAAAHAVHRRFRAQSRPRSALFSAEEGVHRGHSAAGPLRARFQSAVHHGDARSDALRDRAARSVHRARERWGLGRAREPGRRGHRGRGAEARELRGGRGQYRHWGMFDTCGE